jgi:cobalt ECF transporter T component CbiQ
MANKIPSFLLNPSDSHLLKQDTGKVRISFIDKGIHHLAGVIKREYLHLELLLQHGFFQRVDARIKVLFLLFLILVVSLKRDVRSEIAIGIFVFGLVLLSRISLSAFYKRVLLLGFLFGFLVALPSAFNVITKGEIILPIARLSGPTTFWIYHIPADIGITREGMYGVTMLTLRVVNSLALSFLVLYTTPFAEIVRALRVLKVPHSFLIILTLCYKYIFVFSRTVEDMYLSKKSRLVRDVSNKKAREWIAGRLDLIFRKSQRRCEELFQAMLSRGFSDAIKIHGFKALGWWDGLTGLSLFLIGIFFLWI